MTDIRLRLRPLEERHPESGDEIRALQRRAEAAEAERDRLQETNARLHRRAQAGEKAMAERGPGQPNLGRACANFAAMTWKGNAEAAEAERDRLREALEELSIHHMNAPCVLGPAACGPYLRARAALAPDTARPIDPPRCWCGAHVVPGGNLSALPPPHGPYRCAPNAAKEGGT